MPTSQKRMLKTTLVLSLIIVVSKVVGFVREAVLAAQFGQSLEKSAYLTAFQIISIFTIFLSAGIGSSFIPIYTKTRIGDGEEKANAYAASMLNLYILFGILISVLGVFFFAPELSALIWHGSAEGLAMVTELTRVMMPSLAFWAAAGVLVNILNARKHFIPEQLMGFAISFCVILACVLHGSIQMVAVATSLSAVMQVVILLPFLRKRFRYKPKVAWKSKDLWRTFAIALPAFISITFDEINTLVDTVFASGMGDNVPSAINESYRLVQPVLGVLVVPITTVMFSQLAIYAAKKQMGEMKTTVRKSIEIIALITIPVIVVAFIMQTDFISLFYERGKYTAANTAFTAPVFAFYILGVFAFGLRNFLTRVFYSLQKTWIPMVIGACSVGLNILLDYLFSGPLGAKGLTLATSIASTVGALLMIVVMRKMLGRMDFKKSLGQFMRILACAAACGVTVFLLYRNLPVSGGGFADNLLRIAVCGGAGLLAYVGCAFLLKVETAGSLKDIIKGKLRRRGKDGGNGESGGDGGETPEEP